MVNSNHPMGAAPVLVLRVQGDANAQGVADCLRGYTWAAPKDGGQWHTLKVRARFGDVQALAEDLRVPFSLKCCGCADCAAQVTTGRDCMGARA